MSQVIARFRCSEVTAREFGPATVKLSAVYSPDGTEPDEVQEEIRRFNEATPSGNLEMAINNQAAAEHFQPGEHYYLRLEHVAKPDYATA